MTSGNAVTVDPRTPVLVGVGIAHRPPDGSAGVEPVELMAEAVLAAGKNAGAPGLATRAGMIAVPGGNWSYPDPGRLVAGRVGATDARTVLSEIGVPQITPINVALDRIARGELDVAVVVGGEAMASRLRAQRAGDDDPQSPGGDLAPDELWAPQGEIMADAEVATGIWAPVEQYACIENARRAAAGLSIDAHLDDIAKLWAGFNEVAQRNPLADFATPLDAAFIRAAGPGNRPLAFPYAKWHVTQWSVDQAAALLLCSAEAADAAGVARDRWVFPVVSVESSLSLSLTKRDEMHRWPAMAVLGDAAAECIGRPLDAIEHTELYSCFPAAVRVQQVELGLPLDEVPSVTGGMAFAGGPFNNFTYQATAAVVDRLRNDPDGIGMVTTVSGLLTKPGLAVWSSQPPGAPPLVVDLVDAAREATATREVTTTYDGTARVATYTITYEAGTYESGSSGGQPDKAFVIADLADGGRWIGISRSHELLARATTEEVIGTTVRIQGSECAPA